MELLNRPQWKLIGHVIVLQLLRIEKSFDRDIDKINDKKLLKKLQTFISAIKDVETLHEMPHIKKIVGYD